MRIAIVDQHGNPGGGIRFVRALAEGLAQNRSSDEITIFATAPVLAMGAMRDLVGQNANVHGVSLGGEERIPGGAAAPGRRVSRLRETLREVPALARLYRALRGLPEPQQVAPPDPTFRFTDELLAKLEGYDVIYLSWPFFIEPPDRLPAPVVATFHDFNFKHDFGNFTPSDLVALERQVPGWLDRVAVAVVSTDFIRTELERFYPGRAPETAVIPLATFVTSRPSPERVAETVARLGLPERYTLYPCNIARHKNIPGIFEMQARLKRTGSAVPLVLCGWGTDFIVQRMLGQIPKSNPYLEDLAAALKASGLEVGKDVFLLGYVSDADIDSLISGSALVVSPSRYEAGSGPGLDAWALSVPVALSGIPPHREQIEKLHVAAYFFDESDPDDMARVVAGALGRDNSEMVARSAEALARYGWSAVAARYREVFERAAAPGTTTG